MTNIISLEEMLRNGFKEKHYIIEDLINPGAYVLAGAPKCGKTILATQIAVAVATNSKVFERNVNCGKVLYLGLEDNEDGQSFYERCSGLTKFGPNIKNLLFSSEKCAIRYILKNIENCIDEYDNLKMVVIDTYQVLVSGKYKYTYAQDYNNFERLNKFAVDNNICILILHHTRKMKADDPFDEITGTRGISGACEGMFVLKRDNLSSVGKLYIRGRSQRENVFTLTLDSKSHNWIYRGEETKAGEACLIPIVKKVVDFMAEKNEWQGTATELVKAINEDILPQHLSNILNINKDNLKYVADIELTTGRNANTRWLKLQKIKNCEDSANNDKNSGIENNNAIEYKEENAIE